MVGAVRNTCFNLRVKAECMLVPKYREENGA
jgi:hypothetical protein